MTTLELAKKLDQCLAAQVKLQEERDALVKALQSIRVRVDASKLIGKETHRDVAGIIRAALLRVETCQNALVG